MARRQEGLTLNYNAGAAVGAYRIVVHGASDNLVIQAAAATDALIGIADQLGADAADEPIDVIRSGLAEVEYGGNVTRGDLLTADSEGRAVTAATGGRLIGVAEENGVSGDIGSIMVTPGANP